MKLVCSIVASLIATSSLAAGTSQWVSTWGAAPVPPGPAMGPLPATPGFSNQTIRQIVRISAGGNRVRIRFTNEFGTKPLAIGGAHIGIAGSKGSPLHDSHPVLFAGRPSVSIPAGSPMVSDPIDLHVDSLATLAISVYVPEDTGPCTCHPVGMQGTAVSAAGDFTDKDFAPAQTIQARVFLSGVDVETTLQTKAIVAFGDSITDGVGSTVDANRRWPDRLAERLAHRGTTAWGMVNMGISGNRVLGDGAGQSALARFDRDVLAVPGAAYVVLFEGVNDLGISFGHFAGPMAEVFKSLIPAHKATSTEIIAGYKQLIARAHSKGMKVLGATIVPYEGAAYYSPEGEAERLAINTWIRNSGEFDGVLDFDAVMRDPKKPSQMQTALQAGDHLHGSDLGYEAIANSIDLSLFK